MAMLWLWFISCAVAIIISGTFLARDGDVIAEKTGLGRAFVGFILLAVITSMPELITSISAVTLVDAPDIAVGNITGSLVFNLAILAGADIISKETSIFHNAFKGHFLSAGLGIILAAVMLIPMLLGTRLPSFGHIGLYTPVIIGVFLIGTRLLYRYSQTMEKKMQPRHADMSLARAVLFFLLNTMVIIVSATMLSYVAEKLSIATGLGRTFMGTVFVGMTTSLPEVVVTISAVRFGAREMAIENILGSNVFDIVILAITDIFYTGGPLFSHIASTHIFTGIMAIMMTAVVIMSVEVPPKKKIFFRLGWGTAILLFLWFLTIYILYVERQQGGF